MTELNAGASGLAEFHGIETEAPGVALGRDEFEELKEKLGA